MNREFWEIGIRYDFQNVTQTKFYQEDSLRLVERPGRNKGSTNIGDENAKQGIFNYPCVWGGMLELIDQK